MSITFNPTTESSFNPTTQLNIERLFDGQSSALSQNPTGLGVSNSIQIEFGTAKLTASDPIQLLSDGTIKVNTTGLYRLQVTLQLGRSGGANGC